jgi:anti-sigma factor RsiW
MRCERARELIGAHVDGELDRGDAAAIAAHLESCASCRELMSDIQHVSGAMAALGREPAPEALLQRVRSSLASAAEQQEARALWWRVPPHFVRQAAQLAAACVLSVLLTWWILSFGEQRERLESELLTAHIRSLIQDSPIQVASSDTHTVKPWFAGRVDFAPEVKDLTAEGYPLVGGRLDYVGERRVGALVYRRRLHVINVFMWPAANAETAPPRLMSKHGYNLLAWNKGGISYWAVSDLDAAELQRLQSLL